MKTSPTLFPVHHITRFEGGSGFGGAKFSGAGELRQAGGTDACLAAGGVNGDAGFPRNDFTRAGLGNDEGDGLGNLLWQCGCGWPGSGWIFFSPRAVLELGFGEQAFEIFNALFVERMSPQKPRRSAAALGAVVFGEAFPKLNCLRRIVSRARHINEPDTVGLAFL